MVDGDYKGDSQRRPGEKFAVRLIASGRQAPLWGRQQRTTGPTGTPSCQVMEHGAWGALSFSPFVSGRPASGGALWPQVHSSAVGDRLIRSAQQMGRWDDRRGVPWSEADRCETDSCRPSGGPADGPLLTAYVLTPRAPIPPVRTRGPQAEGMRVQTSTFWARDSCSCVRIVRIWGGRWYSWARMAPPSVRSSSRACAESRRWMATW